MPTRIRPLILALGVAVAILTTSRAADEAVTHVPTELTFESARDYAGCFNDVSVDLAVETPAGRQLRVPMFWAGTRLWKARYASSEAGIHSYRTECSDTSNAGLHGITGEIKVKPYAGENPLFRHGPLRIAENRRHFEHADATPFLWLGDTCWMGLCQRLVWPGEFQQYVPIPKTLTRRYGLSSRFAVPIGRSNL